MIRESYGINMRTFNMYLIMYLIYDYIKMESLKHPYLFSKEVILMIIKLVPVTN